MSNFAADLLGLLDRLELEKVHLIGETVGGTISLQFAHEHPDRLHSLTVCTSPYKFAGVDTYREYHRMVQEEGVAGWVRNTADRRIDPASDPGHHQWYVTRCRRLPSGLCWRRWRTCPHRTCRVSCQR